jgi:hypothetical protein
VGEQYRWLEKLHRFYVRNVFVGEPYRVLGSFWGETPSLVGMGSAIIFFLDYARIILLRIMKYAPENHNLCDNNGIVKPNKVCS